QELLALAERQGLLYFHQLPQFPTNGTPAAPDRQLFSQLLNGQTQSLEPVRPGPVDLQDIDLDPAQRDAVAKAVSTPDFCLIQGLPGSGKSRVVAEIIRQAVARGERILFLAPAPPALDRVLHDIASSDTIFPIRCLDRDELVASLHPNIRA